MAFGYHQWYGLKHAETHALLEPWLDTTKQDVESVEHFVQGSLWKPLKCHCRYFRHSLFHKNLLLVLRILYSYQQQIRLLCPMFSVELEMPRAPTELGDWFNRGISSFKLCFSEFKFFFQGFVKRNKTKTSPCRSTLTLSFTGNCVFVGTVFVFESLLVKKARPQPFFQQVSLTQCTMPLSNVVVALTDDEPETHTGPCSQPFGLPNTEFVFSYCLRWTQWQPRPSKKGNGSSGGKTTMRRPKAKITKNFTGCVEHSDRQGPRRMPKLEGHKATARSKDVWKFQS